MSVNSKMTAIANKIRELLGISEAMGLDAMSDNLGAAVNECDTQADLISQLKGAITENVTKTTNEVSEQTTLIQQLKGAIGENVSKTFSEVSEQASLIAEIKTALEGKAGGGGSDARFKDLVEGTLTELYDDAITTTRAYAFDRAKSLVKVCLPKLTSLGSNTFYNCTDLIEVDLPNLAGEVAYASFNGCSALKYVNIPNATSLASYTFENCTSLEKLELGELTSIGTSAFKRSGIKTLIIRNNTTELTKLNSTNVFANSPIANGEGYIYFYREYVDSYKAASNWSDYADFIRAIEDYPEITGG